MFLKDSGLIISDAAALNVGDYENAVINYNDTGEPFMEFEPIKTKKTGALSWVCVGPEAVKAVDAYLKERQSSGEALTAKTPLFSMTDGRRVSKASFSNTFSRLSSKLGKEGRRISAHSLRKFHATILEASMPRSYVVRLQGKKVNDSMGPYELPEEIPGELMRTYIDAYDRIRVFKARGPILKRLRC